MKVFGSQHRKKKKEVRKKKKENIKRKKKIYESSF